MHDWRAHVRKHLPALKVSPERENEIVAELALQLEQAYSEALSAGATEEEAIRRAQIPFRDWEGLARDINVAEQATVAPDPSPRARWWAGLAQDFRYSLRFLR